MLLHAWAMDQESARNSRLVAVIWKGGSTQMRSVRDLVKVKIIPYIMVNYIGPPQIPIPRLGGVYNKTRMG